MWNSLTFLMMSCHFTQCCFVTKMCMYLCDPEYSSRKHKYAKWFLFEATSSRTLSERVSLRESSELSGCMPFESVLWNCSVLYQCFS
uniref:Secreted protein n=1 Tax=Anguilla anguilla TaxID=7936 RepID=A0A0E9PAY1_ANGAN